MFGIKRVAYGVSCPSQDSFSCIEVAKCKMGGGGGWTLKCMDKTTTDL